MIDSKAVASVEAPHLENLAFFVSHTWSNFSPGIIFSSIRLLPGERNLKLSWKIENSAMKSIFDGENNCFRRLFKVVIWMYKRTLGSGEDFTYILRQLQYMIPGIKPFDTIVITVTERTKRLKICANKHLWKQVALIPLWISSYLKTAKIMSLLHALMAVTRDPSIRP